MAPLPFHPDEAMPPHATRWIVKVRTGPRARGMRNEPRRVNGCRGQHEGHAPGPVKRRDVGNDE
jgi:hypothetical protein